MYTNISILMLLLILDTRRTHVCELHVKRALVIHFFGLYCIYITK